MKAVGVQTIDVEVRQEIRWFKDSPDAGDPACVCSYCGNRIEGKPEEDELEELNEEEPIRVWTNQGAAPCMEARFHPRCLEECLERELLSMDDWKRKGAA